MHWGWKNVNALTMLADDGTPTTHEDDPDRAVLAALAIQEAVHRYAAALTEQDGIELKLKIGASTGEVIAVTMGGHAHREETAMGRAVTLAARMEESCEPGTVLVDENTYRSARGLFEWQSLGEIAVKGLEQPLAVYRPLAHSAMPGREQSIEEQDSPLPGIAL